MCSHSSQSKSHSRFFETVAPVRLAAVEVQADEASYARSLRPRSRFQSNGTGISTPGKDALVSDTASSPIAAAIRPREVVATDNARQAPERAAGIARVAALTDGRCSGGFAREATGRRHGARTRRNCRRGDACDLRPRFFARLARSRRGEYRRCGERVDLGQSPEHPATACSGMPPLLSECAGILQCSPRYCEGFKRTLDRGSSM